MTDDKLTKPPSAELSELVDRAAYYGKSTISDATRRGYEMEYDHFRRWAEERGLPAMPPDVPTVVHPARDGVSEQPDGWAGG